MVVIRKLRDGDLPYLHDVWCRLVYEERGFRAIPREVFRAGMNARIRRILARAEVRVASSENDDDVILGFCVLEPKDGIGHLRYVRSEFRGAGIGHALVGDTKIDVCTFRRPDMRQAFNPFLLETG